MTYVEKCLYEYKANIASIEAMKAEREDLMSVQAQNYEGNHGNGDSDPVLEVVSRSIHLEKKIIKVERMTKPVEKLQADLCGSDLRIQQMRDILQLKYMNHEDNYCVRETMAISRRTFERRKRDLLWLAHKYFGQ